MAVEGPIVTKRIINSRSNGSEELEGSEILGKKPESLLQSLVSGYKSRTRSECKAIDAFLVFAMFTGIAQLIYCFLTNAYPYNTFIGVFSASVGSFVFAGICWIIVTMLFLIFAFIFHLANARLQFTRKSDLSQHERLNVVIEFIVCNVILNIFVANFIG
jgi:hypothetical protein